MEPSSDPFSSSEPPTPTPAPRDLGELPNRPPRVADSDEHTPRASRATRDSSVDPFTQNTHFRPLFASAIQQSRTELGAKRGPPSPLGNTRLNPLSIRNQQTFDFSAITTTTEQASNRLVLEARDLLVKAYSTTQSRDRQARLLDLLEVFREFTEYSRIYNIIIILASQVANLEQATKRIENQARKNQAKPNQAS